MILSSNRMRTFEDARLEIVTYVEAQFGLRIRDSRAGDTGPRGQSDPIDIHAVKSLSSGKGEGSSSPRDGRLKCGGAHFQRACNARKDNGKQSFCKGKQSKSWSNGEGNNGWSSVGWHEGLEQTYDTTASSFSLGGLDLGATSSPKRFEWVKMN